MLLVNRLGTFNEVDGIPDGWAEGEKGRQRERGGQPEERHTKPSAIFVEFVDQRFQSVDVNQIQSEAPRNSSLIGVKPVNQCPKNQLTSVN